MIISKLSGGLGNQLFQYAVGRLLADKNKSVLGLDLQNFKFDHKRKYELDSYNLETVIVPISKIREIYEDNRLIRRILKKNTWTYYREKNFIYDPGATHLSGDTYLDGHFMSGFYFSSIRSILLSQLIPVILPSDTIEPNSVAIHVRRGDYVSEIDTQKIHGILSHEYYKKAIHIIKNNVKNPQLYVFTDDPKWAKDNISIFSDAKIIQGNTAAHDLYLMSQCSHHIIANSTFSWWGAWLCQNKDQIVISPSKWFTNNKYNPSLETWIKI